MTHRHFGHNALRKDLRRDLGRSRGPGNRQDLVIVWVRIVVERALRRPFLSPCLQRREFSKRRQVKAPARRHELLDGCWLRQMHKQALGGLLVLAEVPNAPEKKGRHGAKRPFGPEGMPCVHNCSATCGASRLATAQALGGFKINAPRPEMSHLLLEVLSHAGASGGKNRASRV